MGFIRASKYRHVFGTQPKRDQCYDNLKVSRSAWDTNLVSANSSFIAVNLEVGGGGAFTVLRHDQTGRMPEALPAFNGHQAQVLDTDFNPFNDNIIASSSEDCKAMVWSIPEGGLTESISTPELTLSGHTRKVGHVLFNPVADNILATSSADFTVKIWDISTGNEKFELTGHQEIVQSLSWFWKGDQLVTACKDKKLRIFDVRSSKVSAETGGHQGVKGSRVVTMGDTPYLCTTGFSRSSDRQVYIWDKRNFTEPVKQENVDTASGLLVPHYDVDIGILYVAGKGDGNIRYYEWIEEEKFLFPLSEFKSSDPLRGLCFLPKRSCQINECEVALVYKVHPNMIEPISFKVPRKADGFQADIFPDTAGGEPVMSAEEWLGGKTSGPKMISLAKGFSPAPARKFTTSAPSTGVSRATTVGSGKGGPSSEKEYQDAYHSVRKENDELKNVLAARDAKIRQLESQLASLGK